MLSKPNRFTFSKLVNLKTHLQHYVITFRQILHKSGVEA